MTDPKRHVLSAPASRYSAVSFLSRTKESVKFDHDFDTTNELVACGVWGNVMLSLSNRQRCRDTGSF